MSWLRCPRTAFASVNFKLQTIRSPLFRVIPHPARLSCMKHLLLLFFFFPVFLFAQDLDVRKFGAKGDGRTLNTRAIQAALDKAARQGGGTVVIPAGRFLTGSLRLGSHTELRLAPGAVLLGSTRLADYDTAHAHLLYASGAVNVSITGTGTIDGQGEAFYDTTKSTWAAKPRPEPWLLFENCSRIRVRDVQLVRSPSHVLVLDHSEDVVVDGISIRCDLRSPNTDGIDITDSRHVMISNCFMESGDDLICLKSDTRYVEYVTVTNCVLKSDDAAIKFGTGSHVGVRNCTFSNITIFDSRYGIALFMPDGGTHEHCLFENIAIRNGSRWKNDYPIFIDIHKRTPESSLGRIKDMQFRNLTIQTSGNVLVAGQPEQPLQDISFDGLHLTLTGCNDVTQYSQKPRGNKTLLPIPGLVDYARVSAHFTLAHIEGLGFQNVSVRLARKVEACERHTMWLKDVSLTRWQSPDIGPGLDTDLVLDGLKGGME